MSEQHIWCLLDKDGQIIRPLLDEKIAQLDAEYRSRTYPDRGPYRVVRARVILESEDA